MSRMHYHVTKLMEARSHLIDVKMDGYPEAAYHPDSDIGKALEAAELAIELAWSLIEKLQANAKFDEPQEATK